MATPKHRSAAPQPAVRSRRSTPRPRPASGGRAAPAPAPRKKAAAPKGARAPKAAPASRRSGRGPAVARLSTHRSGRPRRPPVAPGRHKHGRRFAVVYDLDGPRVRLGIAWFVLIMGALAIDRLVLDVQLLPFVMAGVAAAAAMEIVDAWQGAAVGADRYVAGASAAAIGMSAVLGARLTGLVVLLVVVVALVVAGMRATRRSSILAGAGLTLQACLLPGITAAGVVLSMRYEIGAVLLLLFFVCAFDLGDFLVGSGADSVIEGPIAGGAAILVVTAIAAVVKAPPFHGAGVWAFGVLAVVACPAGQMVGGLLLPDATVRAPALRRLDSLLVIGPLWAWLVGLYVVSTR
jgi:hypothetical protein